MEFNELKSNWKESSGTSKSQSELKIMTSIKSNSKLKRIRLKLIIESTLLTLFLFSFYTMLDGNTKPIWLNILLGFSILLFIINGITGFLTLNNPINGINLKESIETFLIKLKKLSIMSIVCSLLFGGTLILFLTDSVNLNQNKYFLLIGMIITLVIVVYFSYRNWNYRINRIENVIKELNVNQE